MALAYDLWALCTIDKGQTARCWGEDWANKVETQKALPEPAYQKASVVQAIPSDKGHCVRTADGSLWCQGQEAPVLSVADAVHAFRSYDALCSVGERSGLTCKGDIPAFAQGHEAQVARVIGKDDRWVCWTSRKGTTTCTAGKSYDMGTVDFASASIDLACGATKAGTVRCYVATTSHWKGVFVAEGSTEVALPPP